MGAAIFVLRASFGLMGVLGLGSYFTGLASVGGSVSAFAAYWAMKGLVRQGDRRGRDLCCGGRSIHPAWPIGAKAGLLRSKVSRGMTGLFRINAIIFGFLWLSFGQYIRADTGNAGRDKPDKDQA